MNKVSSTGSSQDVRTDTASGSPSAGTDPAEVDANAEQFSALMHPPKGQVSKKDSDSDKKDKGDASKDGEDAKDAKDSEDGQARTSVSDLLAGMIKSMPHSLPGSETLDANQAPGQLPSSAVDPAPYEPTSYSSTSDDFSSSYNASSSYADTTQRDENTGDSSWDPNNSINDPSRSHNQNQNQDDQDDQNDQDDADKDKAKKTDAATNAQQPSGDQVLQGMLGHHGAGVDASAAGAATGEAQAAAVPVSELVDRLADRVLVADRSTGSESSVRINLREDVLQGTEITLTRSQGHLIIGFTVSNPELLNQLQKQTDSLQLGLEQRLDELVRVEVKPKAAAAATGSSTSGSSTSGGDSSDGRSRNRQEYQQLDDDDDDKQR